MRWGLIIALSVWLASCNDPAEPCLEFEERIGLGEELLIRNCSKNYEELELTCPGVFFEDQDLPYYSVRFDRPGTFTLRLKLFNEDGSESLEESVVVVNPGSEDILGKWRLYKVEEIGEFIFEELNNVYDYEPYAISAHDEVLHFQDTELSIDANQNVDPYFFWSDTLSWALYDGTISNNNRKVMIIDDETFFLVGLDDERMILYSEYMELFSMHRELLYFERRN